MFNRIKNAYHLFLAWFGDFIFGHPSRHLYVIGVTGTKGKTTTTELIGTLLESAGKRVAVLSSAYVKVSGVCSNNTTGNTMPGRLFIQRWLRRAVDSGCEYAILEVTSQGAVQHRHRYIDFDAALLTGLHPEHIESHGSFESYRAAKVGFFRDVATRSSKLHKLFVVNTDCPDARYFEQAILHPVGNGSFGSLLPYNKADFVNGALEGKVEKVSEWLRSDFNLENAAGAYALLRRIGIPADVVLSGLRTFRGVAGRQEVIRGANGQTVVIDYALTPDSLRALYEHLSRLLKKSGRQGRLIAVFGSAGGGRDTWKRPELGRVAAEFCDEIFLTTDDSYDEDTEVIIEGIKSGITGLTPRVIINRRDAITTAILEAGPHDIVAVTGMGSQTYTYGPRGTKLPWSDRAEVERALGGVRA